MITTYCVYVDEKWFRPKTKCSNSLKILNYSDYDRLKKIGSPNNLKFGPEEAKIFKGLNRVLIENNIWW